jgi:hypothetical protein
MNSTKVLRMAQRLQRAEALLRRLHDVVLSRCDGVLDAELCQAITEFFEQTQRRAEQ